MIQLRDVATSVFQMEYCLCTCDGRRGKYMIVILSVGIMFSHYMTLTTINEHVSNGQHVIGAMHSTEECKGFHYRKEFQSNKP